MAINENIVTGRKYRHCVDVATKLWERISFWTKADDVEFDDGKTAQNKVGAIKGITTSLATTKTGYAADATVIKGLNNRLNGLSFAQDSNGNWGYKVGADPVVPFSNGGDLKLLWLNNNPSAVFSTQTITVPNLSKYKTLVIKSTYWSGGTDESFTAIKNYIKNQAYGITAHNPIVDNWASATRSLTVLSDTQIKFGNGYNADGLRDNTAIPIAIYGIGNSNESKQPVAQGSLSGALDSSATIAKTGVIYTASKNESILVVIKGQLKVNAGYTHVYTYVNDTQKSDNSTTTTATIFGALLTLTAGQTIKIGCESNTSLNYVLYNSPF